MRIIVKLLTIISFILLTACGGGDDDSEGGGGSSPTSSVSLATNIANINIPYASDENSNTVEVAVNYSGKAIAVGYAPGVEIEEFLDVSVTVLDDKKATVNLTYTPEQKLSSVGTKTTSVRVAVGDTNGENIAYKDLTVNLVQLDGLDTSGSDLHASAGKENGWLSIGTQSLAWSIQSETEWLTLSSSSGSGSKLVKLTYDYTKVPAGQSVGLINLEATNGTDTINKTVSIMMNNNVVLTTESSLDISSVWGAAAQEKIIRVNTGLQNWEISSNLPGIIFSPTSGSGISEVLVSYNNVHMPLVNVGDIIVEASGQSDSISYEVMFSSPSVETQILSEPNSDRVSMRQNIYMMNPMEEVNFILDDGVIVPWEIASKPDWLDISVQTGKSDQSIKIAIDNDKLSSDSTEGTAYQSLYGGRYTGQLDFTIPILGSPINISYFVEFESDRFSLIIDDSSHAFFDYATDKDQLGAIKIMNHQVLTENELLLEATTEDDWVGIDITENDEIKFHLNTINLPNGFHRTRVKLSVEGNDIVIPSYINIGYYKSDSISTDTSMNLDYDIELYGADALGPMVYLTKSEGAEVLVYNSHLNQFEAPIEIDGITWIDSIKITEDGESLIIQDRNTNELFIYDLINQNVRGKLSPPGGSVNLFNVGAEQFLYIDKVYNLKTLEVVEIMSQNNHLQVYSNNFVSSLSDGILIGLSSNSECGLMKLPINFKPATNTISVTEPSYVSGGSIINEPVDNPTGPPELVECNIERFVNYSDKYVASIKGTTFDLYDLQLADPYSSMQSYDLSSDFLGIYQLYLNSSNTIPMAVFLDDPDSIYSKLSLFMYANDFNSYQEIIVPEYSNLYDGIITSDLKTFIYQSNVSSNNSNGIINTVNMD